MQYLSLLYLFVFLFLIVISMIHSFLYGGLSMVPQVDYSYSPVKDCYLQFIFVPEDSWVNKKKKNNVSKWIHYTNK